MVEKFTEHFKPVSYISSPLFDKHGVKHMFTRRHGGVSNGVYESFNFAAGSGSPPDDWANVVENHRLAASVFGLDTKDICRTYQTHTTKVLPVDKGFCGTGLTKPPFAEGVDGLVCADSGVLLSVRGADCVTVLLYDVKNKICGACHSGWRGTAGGIVKNAVVEMCRLGAEAESIIAAIGPSVGGCCYSVNEDVLAEFVKANEAFMACFEYRGGTLFLNLQQAISQTLIEVGIKSENISDCGECTVCNGNNYFSHRKSGVMRGTMAAFITV